MYLSTLMINVGTDPDRPRPGRLWLRNAYRVHQRLAMAFPSDRRKERDPEFLEPYRPEDFAQQHGLLRPSQDAAPSDTLTQVHTRRGAGAGFLFRIDPLPGGRAMIVVLSHEQPDWDYAFGLNPGQVDPQTRRPIGNAGHLLAAPPEAPRHLQVSLKPGARFHFRLTANPTKKTRTLPKQERLAKTPKRHGCRVPVRPEEFADWLVSRSERYGFRLVEPLRDTLSVVGGYVYMNKKHNASEGQHLRSVRYDGLLEITNVERFREALLSGIGPAKAFGFGLLSVAPV